MAWLRGEHVAARGRCPKLNPSVCAQIQQAPFVDQSPSSGEALLLHYAETGAADRNHCSI
jgi:hypothetical protein